MRVQIGVPIPVWKTDMDRGIVVFDREMECVPRVGEKVTYYFPLDSHDGRRYEATIDEVTWPLNDENPVCDVSVFAASPVDLDRDGGA